MDKTQSTNKMTTVKTVYARAVLLLLTLNFCLTTYVVLNLNKTVQDQMDGAASTTSSAVTPTVLGSKAVTVTAPGTLEATTENP